MGFEAGVAAGVEGAGVAAFCAAAAAGGGGGGACADVARTAGAGEADDEAVTVPGSGLRAGLNADDDDASGVADSRLTGDPALEDEAVVGVGPRGGLEEGSGLWWWLLLLLLL